MKKNMNTSSPALTEDQDRKKMRRAALIKMLAMFIFCIVVMIFGSMHMTTKQMTAETA